LDNEEINYVVKQLPFKLGLFLNKSIPEVAALISKSTLFISNDTGIMHVAGTTNTPQISIFGPTNPLNWAPIGENKYFIRKSEFIDDIEVDDVLKLVVKILN
jgi:heptosyltransferase-2